MPRPASSTLRARLYILLAGMILSMTTTHGMAEQQTTDEPPSSAAVEQQLQKEWSEAVQALKHYSVAQRDRAVAEAAKTLEAMDEGIERLEARAKDNWSQLSESARQRTETSLSALRQQRNELAEWYGGMKHSSAAAWGQVKQGFIGAYDSLSDAFTQAWTEFEQTDADP